MLVADVVVKAAHVGVFECRSWLIPESKCVTVAKMGEHPGVLGMLNDYYCQINT